MVVGPRHNDQMPRRRPHWPLAVGLAAGVALDALLGDPRRGHPVAAFGRAAAALEARDYADSRPRGAAHAAACILAAAAPAVLVARGTRSPAAVAGGDGRARGVGGHRRPFATW